MRGNAIKTSGIVAICLFIWALTAVPAQAAQTHILANTFGSFGGPMGVAVDNSTNLADPAAGDVYVVDANNHRVVRFDASGNPAAFSASGSNITANTLTGIPTSTFVLPQFVAVDPANGDFYVSDAAAGAVYKFSPAGNLLTTIDATSGVPVGSGGAFSPFGIVVDPTNESGDIYVENRAYYNSDGYTEGDQIAKFESSGKYGNAGIFATGPIFDEPPVDNFAMSSAGDFYVVLQGQKVAEYNATGSPIGTLDSHAPTAVAIDPSNGDIYVAENSPQRVIREFNSNGEPIDSFGVNSFGSTYGLAVDDSHNVYVTDNSGTTVKLFRQGTPPTVIASPADEVTASSARFNGSIEPAGNGEVIDCHFEYGTSTSYSLGSVPCKQGTHFSSPTDVNAEVSGLAPSTTYHFRLVASNATITNPGGDQSFTTSASVKIHPTSSFGHFFSNPTGAAVDNSGGASAGDLWVVDRGNHVVDKFNETGTYICQLSGPGTGCTPAGAPPSFALPWQAAVDNSNGDLYVADLYGSGGEGTPGMVDKFDESGGDILQIKASAISPGTPGSPGTGGVFEPGGVAVDPTTHDIYVSDIQNNAVDKFTSAGVFVSQLTTGVPTAPLQVAVDTNGHLYVANGGGVVEFDSTGTCVNVGCAPLDSGGSQSVAIDPATNNVYVSDGSVVNEYTEAGSLLDSFGSGLLSGAVYGLSVNSTTKSAYAVDYSASLVYKIDGTSVSRPEVGTGNASSITTTSALLTGVVDPVEGDITDCHFVVGGLPDVPCEQKTPISGATQVTAHLTGLSPGEIYTYHLVAENANGSNSGQEISFTATPEPPAVSGLTVSDVRSDGAVMHANIDPNKADTTYHFEYVTDEQFQASGYAEATSLPSPMVTQAQVMPMSPRVSRRAC